MDSTEREALLSYASLPAFKAKVSLALSRISEALALGKAYVSLSWGKDSTVLAHLCQQICPQIPLHHLGVWHRRYFGNYDEVIAQYLKNNPSDYRETLLNEDNFIFGGDTSEYLLAATGLKNLFLGLRKQESKARRIALSKCGWKHQYTSGSRSGVWRFCPLLDWRTQDVWAYIAAHDLPYLAFYDSVGKMSHESRTTALEGLRLRNTKADPERRGAIRYASPEFKAWEQCGEIHVFVLLCLQLLNRKQPRLSASAACIDWLLSEVKQTNVTDRELKLLQLLFSTGETIDPFALKLLKRIKEYDSNMD